MRVKITFILLFSALIYGYTQGPSKTYDFAKSYFGLDLIYTPAYGNSSFINEEGEFTSFNRSAFYTPAINIGATHFWGYADIYISISTVNIGRKENQVDTQVDYGVFTGFRVYPWQLNNRKLRPFVGYKFSPLYYQQRTILGDDASLTKVNSVLDVGLGYRLPKVYIFAGYNRVLSPGITIAVSRDQKIGTRFPRGFVNVGMNWMIETTRTAQNENFKKLNEFFGGTNRYGLFVGLGPSSAFPLLRSDYISDEKPFLDDLALPAIFADAALGYHFMKREVVTAFSFRRMHQFRGALGFRQQVKRTSYLLESYKFFADFHGFMPYVGAGVSFERLHLVESDNKLLVRDDRKAGLTPVLCFGWDIRPAKKHDVFLLRTNLRFSPFLNFSVENKKLSLQHLEFNFIQLVIYPQRIIRMRKMKRP